MAVQKIQEKDLMQTGQVFRTESGIYKCVQMWYHKRKAL